MKQFATLVKVLGSSTKTNDKLQALSDYFAVAGDKDKVWVMAIFSGRRPRRSVNSRLLAEWCMEIVSIPSWLFTECYGTVGDLAETIALLLPESMTSVQGEEGLHFYIEQLKQLEKAGEEEKKKFITTRWMNMDRDERFVFNKLITGSFRIGVSQKTMVNALSKTVNLEANTIAHRISGNWDPSTTLFHELLSADTVDHSRPYPFYLAYALENEITETGNEDERQAEWKWDGIRGQIIQRNKELYVWSRGEELMTEKFPEFHLLKDHLADGTVLDGEIMPYAENKALPFAVLQTRIGRKNITKKHLLEAPVAFIAYDILEYEGKDIRDIPMEERRKLLQGIVQRVNLPVLQLSPVIIFSSWEALTAERSRARDINSEGIMLKRKNSAYGVGRKRGDWWKWKIDPLVIDAVMIYAQKGSGRRSNLYTDYTFAVRDGDQLVSFTKAYSGLTDKEFAEVDNFVKRNSIEKFGPVRTVKPELVFEIAFEGIAASKRHKSGVALRFPRMNRWRKDKKPGEINTLDDLKKMLEMYGK
jgi:ATP-dependent DNA ligase